MEATAAKAPGDLGKTQIACRTRPAFSFERQLFDGDTNDAGSHHAERAGGADRYIDNPAPHERAAIIDPALDRMSRMGHGDDASERPGPMRTGHFAAVTSTTVIGGEAGFGLACGNG
jgi:hypothetical protein